MGQLGEYLSDMMRRLHRTLTAACAAFLLWYYLLMRYGTFSPLFVATHTSAHLPSAARQDPHARVVVSFTTVPHHMDKLRETIDSLKSQTLTPDAIYVNVPWNTSRTGQEYQVPDYMDKAVIVNRCAEYGPLTKLLPTLLLEKDPSTIIITLDDDKIYPNDVVRTLVWHMVQNTGLRVAVGLCGWSFMSVPTARGVVPVYVPWMMRGRHGRRVDVLQAVCGNAYRRGHFDANERTLLRELGSPPKACYTTDDINIAGYLRAHAGVHAVVIPNARHLEPSEPPWKETESKKEVGFRLSSFNLDAYSDLKCMQALDAQWGVEVFA